MNNDLEIPKNKYELSKEELDSFESLSVCQVACETLVKKVIAEFEELEKQKLGWWRAIREKYGFMKNTAKIIGKEVWVYDEWQIHMEDFLNKERELEAYKNYFLKKFGKLPSTNAEGGQS